MRAAFMVLKREIYNFTSSMAHSGSSLGNKVEVQVLLAAPNVHNPNHSPIKAVGEGFGFVLYLAK